MKFLIIRLGIPSQNHKVAVIVFYAILSYSLYWWLRCPENLGNWTEWLWGTHLVSFKIWARLLISPNGV